MRRDEKNKCSIVWIIKITMEYDGIDSITYHHFTLNFVPSNLEDERWNVNFFLLYHKLSKQWYGISIPFYFISFHFILPCSISFHHILSIQTEPKYQILLLIIQGDKLFYLVTRHMYLLNIFKVDIFKFVNCLNDL
jgi:hypothetical protein